MSDQLARIHRRLRAQAKRRACRHGLAEQVPGGKLDRAVLGHKPLRLGALARARCAKENDAQEDVPFSRSGGVSYSDPAVAVKPDQECPWPSAMPSMPSQAALPL